MKIDILTVTGSPQSVTEKTIYGDGSQLGVGGAELALLTMCKVWTERGHEVTLYNNPRQLGASSFAQLHLASFRPQDDRDVLMYFRGPNPAGLAAKGKKVWWSCDQRTVGDYRALADEVDAVVTISPFHARFFEKEYGITNTTTIDIAVREWEYNIPVDKQPNHVLFCSVPDRGLEQLANMWKTITSREPNAHLHITSDWRLWDATLPATIVSKYRMMFLGLPNVHYHSLVGRDELIRLQKMCGIHLYDCVYDELFCISTAECQFAGAFPITSSQGALESTNMGYKSSYPSTSQQCMDDLANVCVSYLNDPELCIRDGSKIAQLAHDRFGIDKVADQWEKVFQ